MTAETEARERLAVLAAWDFPDTWRIKPGCPATYGDLRTALAPEKGEAMSEAGLSPDEMQTADEITAYVSKKFAKDDQLAVSVATWLRLRGHTGMAKAVELTVLKMNSSAHANRRLTAALDLALEWLGRHEPGDSRAVSDEFVAMAMVSAGKGNTETDKIIADAQARAAPKEAGAEEDPLQALAKEHVRRMEDEVVPAIVEDLNAGARRAAELRRGKT